MLETYFIKADNEYGYIKAITHSINWSYFEGLGFKRTRDEAVKLTKLEDMTKIELELYGKNKYNVDIDRRKNKSTLISEIEAMENGDS